MTRIVGTKGMHRTPCGNPACRKCYERITVPVKLGRRMVLTDHFGAKGHFQRVEMREQLSPVGILERGAIDKMRVK